MTRTARMYRALRRKSTDDVDLRDLFIFSINRASRDLLNSFTARTGA